MRAVIPTIITQIFNNKKIIKLGNTFSTRNFNYISDTIDGFIRFIGKNNLDGEIINLGSNYDISIVDTKIISQLMDRKIKIIREEKRKRPKNSEVEKLKASGLKAKIA